MRKRHLNMWLLIGPLVLLGGIIAYASIPELGRDSLRRIPQPEALKEVLYAIDEPDVKINIRVSQDSVQAYQAEIVLKKPLTRPSTLVYLGKEVEDPDLGLLTELGLLGPMGVYRMPLPRLPEADESLLFFDFVKGEMYHQVKLNR